MVELKYKIKPWGHQLTGIQKALEQRDFAFFFEMGAGKTCTTINTLRHRYAEQKRIMRTLVLCPVVVCENWRREFYAHSQIGHQVLILKGSETKRKKLFEEKKDARPSHIFITNFEALQMKGLMQEILKWQPEILVVDESQRLKTYNGTRSQMAQIIARQTAHNYILSGSPITNSPMDIFGQYLILDRGATFGSNFIQFRSKYFYDENAGMPSQRHFPDWQLHEEMDEVFHRRIYKKAMRVMKSECLDLPPLVRMEIDVELSPEQERHYKEMREQFITFLNDESCSASVAIVKALRLQQIVSGYIKLDNGEEVKIKDNPRINALDEMLTDLPKHEKCIIWANFSENYGQISGLLTKRKEKFVELHGLVKTNDRQKNIDAFQNDPSVKYILANKAAGGVGINLTAAAYSTTYSRNFSLEQDIQADARNHRGGSEIHKKITRMDLVARNTIDEIILQALKNKMDMAERILELRDKMR
jgi:SNF2 family DNA or RNA helicase